MSQDNYPEILSALFDGIRYGLLSNQIDKSVSSRVASAVTEQIRQNWGGIMVYIPKGTKHGYQLRNQQIIREFNGKNHAELCKRYQISIQRLYSIIKSGKKNVTNSNADH